MFSRLRDGLMVGVICVSVLGCGGNQPDGSGFQHDAAAKLFLDAMKIRGTDQGGALDLLSQSIEARPSYNAYFHRGWIYALQGNDAQARSDIEAGLALEPESTDLKWLQKELQKPTASRKLDMPPAKVK